MKIRLLLISVLACGQALAQQPSPPMAGGQEGNARSPCASTREGAADTHCAMRSETMAAMPDPGKLMAEEPTAAGPRMAAPTRRQVLAELERARRAGEMDYAAVEIGVAAQHSR